MTDAALKTASLLTLLWDRNRPLVDERLSVLDQAAGAAAEGALFEEQREEAGEVAHKLAGSLGMYGFSHGTQLARQVELMLDYPRPDPVRLRALIAELRQNLFPEKQGS